MIRPAEARFLELQTAFEREAVRIHEHEGDGELQQFLNDNARRNLTTVERAYHELVDYLMLSYLVNYKELAPPRLPRIEPAIVGGNRQPASQPAADSGN